MATAAHSDANASCGCRPKPPKYVAKYDAKPKNIPGTKLSAGTMRPTKIIAPFKQNRMTIWAIVNDVPDQWCEASVNSSTISIAVNDPRTWTGRILRITSRFGPPAANVPAHEMNTAHGGKWGDPFEIGTVVIASSDAEISLGRFSQLRLVSAGARPAFGGGPALGEGPLGVLGTPGLPPRPPGPGRAGG